ncbi:MAG: hypothetical protein K2L17_10415 [Muribaculaceae bacterium]|nr:hypothetical protein [Muribaculaceae bacterium]
MMRVIALLILSICVSINVSALSSYILTEEDKEQVKERIIDKLEDFQFWLGEIANKKNSQKVRTDALKSNIVLFIGKCDPYTVTNHKTGELEVKEAVKMQTSSVRNGKEVKNPPQRMKQYLYNILNNETYSNIKIEQADAVRVDNIRQVGDGEYEAVAYFCQYFTGYRGEENYVAYSDYTEKAVRISIGLEEVRHAGKTEKIIKIKLGDMKVALTERLR